MLSRFFGRDELPGEASIETYDLSIEEAKARASGVPIEDIFFANRGRAVCKWIDYLPVYDRHLSPYRGTDVKLLEIGVNRGGSLQMWREYLGANAVVYGIDIDPECVRFVDPPNEIRIGSQDDPEFLASVISDMGSPDVILDDGSHRAQHQIASFNCLWPKLNLGGLYMIEDTHTAYWRRYGGGYRRPRTAIGLAKNLIDDMHGWWHNEKQAYVSKEEIRSISIYESIFVIEKNIKLRPGHVTVE